MLGRLHNGLLLLVVSGYLLLEYGFMQIRIPPIAGGGVPIGELTLLFCLMVTNHLKLLPRLSATIFLLPFVVWWALGIGRAIAGVPEYGLWALRDATHVIESLFLIAGFVFASRPGALETFFRWLPWILGAIAVYSLGYPFSERLQAVSPKLTAGNGYEAPLLFNYIGINTTLLWATAYLMLFKMRDKAWSTVVSIAVVLLLGYAAFIIQMRTIYLQIAAVGLLFMAFRRDLVGRGLLIVVPGLVIAVMLVEISGIEVEGRLGETVSFGFIWNHILAIVGIQDGTSGGVSGAASGVELRMGWWITLYERWTESVGNFLFGLGYGFPLTDFVVYSDATPEGVPVREPHNSYISIVARTGLVGAVAFVWMNILLVRTWYRSYVMCGRLRWREYQNYLLLFMAYFVLVGVMAFGEDAFEKPFTAIPYYFFWGLVLQMYRRASSAYRQAMESEEPERVGAEPAVGVEAVASNGAASNGADAPLVARGGSSAQSTRLGRRSTGLRDDTPG